MRILTTDEINIVVGGNDGPPEEGSTCPTLGCETEGEGGEEQNLGNG